VARQGELQASGTPGDANNAGVQINVIFETIPANAVI
jgi:hypothetical protein